MAYLLSRSSGLAARLIAALISKQSTFLTERMPVCPLHSIRLVFLGASNS